MDGPENHSDQSGLPGDGQNHAPGAPGGPPASDRTEDRVEKPTKGLEGCDYAKALAQQARRQQVCDLYLKGYRSPIEIGRLLHLQRGQVAADLRYLVRQWQLHQISLIADARAEAIAKLDNLEKHAWEGWDRSKRDSASKTSAKKQKSGGEDGTIVEKSKSTTVEEKVGNPAFLSIVKHCIEERNKLMGLHDGAVRGQEMEEVDHIRHSTPNDNTIGLNLAGKQFPTFAELIEAIKTRTGHLVFQRMVIRDGKYGAPAENAIDAVSHEDTGGESPPKQSHRNGTNGHTKGRNNGHA